MQEVLALEKDKLSFMNIKVMGETMKKEKEKFWKKIEDS